MIYLRKGNISTIHAPGWMRSTNSKSALSAAVMNVSLYLAGRWPSVSLPQIMFDQERITHTQSQVCMSLSAYLSYSVWTRGRLNVLTTGCARTANRVSQSGATCTDPSHVAVAAYCGPPNGFYRLRHSVHVASRGTVSRVV